MLSLKINPMKNLNVLLLVFAIVGMGIFTSWAQEKKKIMKPTSSSSRAVELYNQSIEAAENAEADKSQMLMDEAFKEDPNFFMAHTQNAIFALYSGNRESFNKHAEKAISGANQLNEAELLLKAAMVKLMENPDADLTGTGKKILKMYPHDKNSYYFLATFQMHNNDMKGVIGTYKKGINSVDNPAPFYNMLGYAYMGEGNMKEAEKAFNKYIELNPGHPNPYDSKGDFYMQTQEFDKAYENYMKAHEIDPGWSFEKAEKAKEKMNE